MELVQQRVLPQTIEWGEVGRFAAFQEVEDEGKIQKLEELLHAGISELHL